MAYKNELLRDIYWSFANGSFPTESEYLTELKSYHKEISGKSLQMDLSEIIFPYPKIVVQYLIYNEEEEDYEEPQVLLEADVSNAGFKTGELLYKIHSEIGPKLEDEDNRFFEGLTYAGDDDPDFKDIPVYFLDTGS